MGHSEWGVEKLVRANSQEESFSMNWITNVRGRCSGGSPIIASKEDDGNHSYSLIILTLYAGSYFPDNR